MVTKKGPASLLSGAFFFAYSPLNKQQSELGAAAES